MLQYNEIREKKIIIYNDEPCEVVESHVARTQQRKPQNQTKLRSLISGRAYNATFHVSDSAEEADILKRDVKFIYNTQSRSLPAGRQEYWFCEPNDPAKRFKLEDKILGESVKFLKPNELVTALVFDDGDEDSSTDSISSPQAGSGQGRIISVKLPVKMTFEVKEVSPSIKGSTITGGNKPATLENGAVVNVPMFVNSGDKVVVNTETGEYVERA